MYIYKVNNPLNSDEIIALFHSVGWRKNPLDIIPAFKIHYYITCYHKSRLIAFARAY